MNKIATLFLVSMLSAHSVFAVASINISTFGSTVDVDGWSWNPSSSNLTGTDALGAVLFPSPEPSSAFNFTLLDNYGGSPSNLLLNLTGFVTTAPVGAFTISLEDNLGRVSATPFAWNAFGATTSTVTLSPNVPAAFSWNNVVGWTLDAGGTGGVVNATFTEMTMTAVPEPSTYALVLLGGAALLSHVVHRRRRT
jgi:hypothetical protein